MGLSQWDKYIVESIPVACSDCSIERDIEVLVGETVKVIESGDLRKANELHTTIDLKVCEMYGLTDSELDEISRRLKNA